MLDSILNNAGSAAVSMDSFLLCAAASLALGAALAWIHSYKNRVSGSFVMALVLLPVMVQTVIMLVNGNLGTGVAVMGAFSLVRFRSAPGNAREISSIFLAMAVGLAAGMGYLGVAALLTAAVGVVTVIMVSIPWLNHGAEKMLKITIPESLDYQGIFDDLFSRYTKRAELVRVQTVSMGSLYELHYRIALTDEQREKEFLDQIRCRNGNLTLVCGRVPENKAEL